MDESNTVEQMDTSGGDPPPADTTTPDTTQMDTSGDTPLIDSTVADVDTSADTTQNTTLATDNNVTNTTLATDNNVANTTLATEDNVTNTTLATEANTTLATDNNVTNTSIELNQTLTNTSGNDSMPITKSSTTRSSKRTRTSNAASKPGPTPKRKPRQSNAAAASKDDTGQLFAIVLDGKSAIQSIVDDWVGRYQKDSEMAMLELIQYFVRCCGCRATITSKDFQTQEASVVIRSLTENFAEDSGDYPLIMTGMIYKKFKVNFSEFEERLISQCGDSILYDEYMLDTMVMWLVGLSDSQVRAFRHTSTLACVKLVTGLIKVANAITQDTDNTQRQYDTERKKPASRRAAGKLEKLERKLQELQQQLSELHDMMNTLFTSIFVHRYRDACPDIRSVCIQELGVWMKEYHKVFLADIYLKYIGWTLSDKVGEVRLQSVQALIPLYSSPELAPHVELFTQKFKERLVSMRLDKEDAVQVAAINLCGHLLTLDMLESEECIEICEMVFMDNKKTVSQAAGAFASQYLFSEDFLSKERRNKPPKGHKKPTDAQIKIKELVRFFLEANIHEHTVYLVDSLWDHTEVLQDWEMMVSILVDGSCGVVLSSEGESVLIDMLAYAVKKMSNVTVSTGRGRGKGVSAKDRKALAAGRESIGSTLIPYISDLIAKYGTNVKCAANLTSIPQQFDMEMYVEMRAQKYLEELLDHLKQLVLKHSTDEVLNEIGSTYNHLLNPDTTLHSTVDIAFGQLVDELFTNCKQCLENLKEESYSDENDEDVYNLGINLKRLTALFKQVDLTRWPFVDEVLKLVELGVDGTAADMIVIPSLTFIHLHLLWTMNSLDEANPDRPVMRTVHTLTDKLVKHCHDLMKLGSPDVQKQAYILLCDLLIVFSKQLKAKGLLGALVHSPEPLLQSTMCEYVMEKVFKEAEEDTEPTTDEEAYIYAEKLNDRRVLLAGFLKLLMFSVVEPNVGLPIFGQYVKFTSDYGDLIKKALSHFREHSPLKWYKIVLLTLQHQYTLLQDEGEGQVDHRSAEWADLKDLARRIALTTGFDLVKCRHSIVCVHRDGIRFALHDHDVSYKGDNEALPIPQRLDFLEVLSEFSFRLLPIDRIGEKGILAFLNDQLGDGIMDNVKTLDDWRPLRIYLMSLEKNPSGGGVSGGVADDNEAVSVAKKAGGKGTKRKNEREKITANKAQRLDAHED